MGDSCPPSEGVMGDSCPPSEGVWGTAVPQAVPKPIYLRMP